MKLVTSSSVIVRDALKVAAERTTRSSDDRRSGRRPRAVVRPAAAARPTLKMPTRAA